MGQPPPLLLHQPQDSVLAPPTLVRYRCYKQSNLFFFLDLSLFKVPEDCVHNIFSPIRGLTFCPFNSFMSFSLSRCLPPLAAGFGGLGAGNTTAGGFSFGGFGLNANPAAVSVNVGCFGTATTTGTVFNFGNSLASTGR